MLIASISLSANASGSVQNPATPSHRLQSLSFKQTAPGLSNPFQKGKTSQLKKTGTRADAEMSMDWGYCGNPDMAYDLGDTKIDQCIYVTPEQANKFLGDKITAVMCGNPLNAESFDDNAQQYNNAVKNMTVWIRESLDAAPVTQATGATTALAFDWSDIKLAVPYTVKENTGFYVGVSFDVPMGNQMYCLITDNMAAANEYSNLVYTQTTDIDRQTGQLTLGDKVEWRNLAHLGNACIRPVITGENLPSNEIQVTDYMTPRILKPGEKFSYPIEITNLAANAANTVTVTMEMKGQPTQESVCTIIVDYNNRVPVYGDLAYGEYGVIFPEFTCNVEGSVAYTLTISKINGVENIAEYKTIKGKMTCLKEGFAKNNVVEAATATWNGYCPLEYAGMEYLIKKYGNEGFIGIAMHCDDEMNTVVGDDVAYHFMEYFIEHTESLPSAFMNRHYRDYFVPDPTYYSTYCSDYEGVPSVAEVKSTITASASDPRKITLDTETQFAVSEDDATYGIAYVVVEDNVGPYDQTNYFAGTSNSAYGFEDLDYYVPLVYNGVSRNCSNPLPIANSLPTATSKGEKYKYSAEINLSDVKSTGNYRIVVMVVNYTTNMIENAAQVLSPTYGMGDAVEELTSESGKASLAFGGKGIITVRATGRGCDIYTIDGVRVAADIKSGSVELPVGLYLVTDGKNTSKTIVY